MIFRLVARELYNAKSFVFVFVFNLFLGIFGLVILQSFRHNVNELLEQRAKELSAADLTISSRRDLNQDEKTKLFDILDKDRFRVIKAQEIYSMVRKVHNEKSKLSELKTAKSRLIDLIGVSEGFPHYGKIKFLDVSGKEHKTLSSLYSNKHIVVSKEILHQMKLKLGDKLLVGKLEFTVIGKILADSTTSWRGVSLAPKAYIAQKFLSNTGLLGLGSVSSTAYQVKFLKTSMKNEAFATKLKNKIQKILPDPGIRVRTPRDSSDQVGRVLNIMSDYLGLVALVALLLSGIGAGYLFQNYLFDKLKDIAILRSMGLYNSKIYLIYLLQLFILSFFAAGLANLLTLLLLPYLSDLLFQYIYIKGKLSFHGGTLLISFIVATATATLVCFPILKKMLEKKTKSLFSGVNFFTFSFSTKDLVLYSPLLFFLWALSVYQSHSLQIGSLFTVILIIVSSFLALLGPYCLGVLNKFHLKKKSLSCALGLNFGIALRSFSRQKVSTTLTIVALTLGVMLLAIIGQLESSISSELGDEGQARPSLFLFDIQDEQILELKKLAEINNFNINSLTPLIRSRITKVNNVDFKRANSSTGAETREEQSARRFRNRGVNLSYAKGLNGSEKIYSGRPFNLEDSIQEISVEKRFAKRLGLKLRDQVTFEVLDVEITGVITSLRSVKWTSFRPNFFIVFEDGVINNAPKSFIATVKELSQKEQLKVQDLIVESFPNISIINVTEVINKILNIFKAMTKAIKIMAFLCLLVGIFVLFAIVQNQLEKKKSEAAIQKVFGLKRFDLFLIISFEYLLIVLISLICGIGLSMGVGKVVAHLFFDGVWSVNWSYNLQLGLFITVLTLILTGFSAIKFTKMKVKALIG